jgi:GT2 family glycosyltransferase
LPKTLAVAINYNGAKFIPHFCERLFDLQAENLDFLFLDNASTDNSVELVREVAPSLVIHQTGKNDGYAGAAEIAFRLAQKRGYDYLLLMGTDIVFEADYAKILVEKMEQDRSLGAAVGKLYKYEFFSQQKTRILDSCGLLAYRDRRIVDRGQAQSDVGQFDREEFVFGATGAAPLYRVEALADIEVLAEVFDQDFFMYKEDVDVSWRLQLFGHQILYVPTAVAHHGRGTGIYKRNSYWQIANERKNLSRFQKTFSYRNHKLMQLKNELGANLLHDFWPICRREVLFTGYMTLFEPYLYVWLIKFLILMPKFSRKRRAIMRRKHVDADYMQQFFV